MLYPIIRRVRRPLLPPEALQTATPAVAEQSAVVPPVEETATTVIAPASPLQPEPQTAQPIVEVAPKPPVTETKPKRAKAAEQKSRKLVEPGA